MKFLKFQSVEISNGNEKMKKKEICQASIFLFIAVFLIYALVPFFAGSEKALIVLSGSMTPIMLPGDMIIVKSVDSSELKVGDIIAFSPPGSKPNFLVTHRIISTNEGDKPFFHTKGDANNVKDDFKISISNVVGKLIFVIPFVGYLPEAIKHKSIFFLLIILPAFILIMDEIRTLYKYSNPVLARKMEKKHRKLVRRTFNKFYYKKLTALFLINGLIFSGIVMSNLGNNGHVILAKENKVENFGFLPLVYVLTPDDSKQKFAIKPWYGIVCPDNRTQIIAPENTPAKVSSVPYVLPVFWIIALAAINPYIPTVAAIMTYTSFFTLLLFPLWYRKSAIHRHKKKIKMYLLFAQLKRTFQFE
jgi:signal peptidase I